MSGGPVPVYKKYTAASKGIWEKIRQLLVIVPNRSTGNPVVPMFRVPAPGSRPEASSYEDPATLPTSDIADNRYYARDHRRHYPKTAFYNQSKIAGLLEYGNAVQPRIADGQAGHQALAQVEDGGLSLTQIIASSTQDVIKGSVLDKNGLPPIPPSLVKHHYRIVAPSDSGMYDDTQYPVRSFE